MLIFGVLITFVTSILCGLLPGPREQARTDEQYEAQRDLQPSAF